MDYQQIKVEDREEVRLLVLSRPERLNAWTERMHTELVHAIEEGNVDKSVGAFVMTGDGRAFCAGADIGDVFGATLEDESVGYGALTESVNWVGLVRDSKPMVAAVNGPAIGLGLTMLLSMDFIVAQSDAKLSARFVKMGVVPELASSHFLVQRCGWGMASDLALSGRTISGDEAKIIGLVDEVVPDDVVGAAITRARSYAENAPSSLQLTKRLLTENASETDLDLVQRREGRANEEAGSTPEHREAVNAFLEKRAPKFR